MLSTSLCKCCSNYVAKRRIDTSSQLMDLSRSCGKSLRHVLSAVERYQDSKSAKKPPISGERVVNCLVILADEVLGLAEKDVDLRNLAAAASPTKKRPSMENILDVPPIKKAKSEAIDE